MRRLEFTGDASRPFRKDSHQHPLVQEPLCVTQSLSIRSPTIHRERPRLPHEPPDDGHSEELLLCHEQDWTRERSNDEDRIRIVEMVGRNDRWPDPWHMLESLNPKADQKSQQWHNKKSCREKDKRLNFASS